MWGSLLIISVHSVPTRALQLHSYSGAAFACDAPRCIRTASVGHDDRYHSFVTPATCAAARATWKHYGFMDTHAPGRHAGDKERRRQTSILDGGISHAYILGPWRSNQVSMAPAPFPCLASPGEEAEKRRHVSPVDTFCNVVGLVQRGNDDAQPLQQSFASVTMCRVS